MLKNEIELISSKIKKITRKKSNQDEMDENVKVREETEDFTNKFQKKLKRKGRYYILNVFKTSFFIEIFFLINSLLILSLSYHLTCHCFFIATSFIYKVNA